MPGATREAIKRDAGHQPGDPAKAAAVILQALAADQAPLHLPLGDDAVDAILGHLESLTAELRSWESIARDTALEAPDRQGTDHFRVRRR